MSKFEEIIGKYTSGKATLADTNAALKEAGANYQLDPEKNILSEAEKRATTVGYYLDQVNGYGLLDDGTGTMEKVKLVAGKLPDVINQVQSDGTTNMAAYVYIAGRKYEVKGDAVAECDNIYAI